MSALPVTCIDLDPLHPRPLPAVEGLEVRELVFDVVAEEEVADLDPAVSLDAAVGGPLVRVGVVVPCLKTSVKIPPRRGREERFDVKYSTLQCIIVTSQRNS